MDHKSIEDIIEEYLKNHVDFVEDIDLKAIAILTELQGYIHKSEVVDKEALKDIIGICVDYDGYRSVEGLKSLIDDIRDYAGKCLDIGSSEDL